MCLGSFHQHPIQPSFLQSKILVKLTPTYEDMSLFYHFENTLITLLLHKKCAHYTASATMDGGWKQMCCHLQACHVTDDVVKTQYSLRLLFSFFKQDWGIYKHFINWRPCSTSKLWSSSSFFHVPAFEQFDNT